MVLQVASLVDSKPFPTLFWLVNPQLNLAIDKLEAAGLIAQMQEKLDAKEAYQQQLADAHRAHIQLRSHLMTDDDHRRVRQFGFEQVFKERGIGGIKSFNRIRCLHTYYAAHLVSPNLIGQWEFTRISATILPPRRKKAFYARSENWAWTGRLELLKHT